MYKRVWPGDVYGPRRATLDRMRQNVQPRFLYFCGYCYGGVFFHFFKHPRSKRTGEYLYLTLNRSTPLPLSHFPKSQTNLIPKPFFAHNSLHINHHFPPLTPHSHLFHAIQSRSDPIPFTPKTNQAKIDIKSEARHSRHLISAKYRPSMDPNCSQSVSLVAMCLSQAFS